MMKIIITGGSGFIGTHLSDELIANSIDFINIDINSPSKNEQRGFWHNISILDMEKLEKVICDYQPTMIIHLAAQATMDGESLDDYQVNTIGTQNLVDVVRKCPSVSRVIVASSQHVRKPGSGFQTNDEDFNPHGLYGESKVITEKITRSIGQHCEWVIIRPTTVWGPWHPYLPYGLWHMMRKGLYVHPKNDPVVRSYGYVKNVAWQILQILNSPSNSVNQKVFYVGDSVMPQIDWINAFSIALANHQVIQMPKQILKVLALVGDLMELVGIKFPMDSARYYNLTTMNEISLDPIFELYGIPPYSLEQGIQETMNWLNNES